jgi:chromosome segregation ATPase
MAVESKGYNDSQKQGFYNAFDTQIARLKHFSDNRASRTSNFHSLVSTGIKKIQADLGELSGLSTRVATAFAANKQALAAAKQELQIQQQRVQQQEHEIAGLNQTITRISDQLRDCRENLHRINDEKVVLEDQLEAQKERLAHLNALENEMQAKEFENAALKQQLDSERAKLQQKQTELDTAHNDSLQMFHEHAEAQRKYMDEEIGKRDKENLADKAELDATRANFHTLEAEHARLKLENSNLKGELDRINAEKQTLEEQHAELMGEQQQHVDNLAKLTAENTALITRIINATTAITGYMDNIESLRADPANNDAALQAELDRTTQMIVGITNSLNSQLGGKRRRRRNIYKRTKKNKKSKHQKGGFIYGRSSSKKKSRGSKSRSRSRSSRRSASYSLNNKNKVKNNK